MALKWPRRPTPAPSTPSPATDDDGGVATTQKKKLAGGLVEIAVILVVALGLAFGIQAFIVKPYRIPSGSMLPTLRIGQRVLVDRIGMHFSSPSVGDIVVFHPPADAIPQPPICGGPPHAATEVCPMSGAKESSENFIKRVVATPGDVIQIVNGHVILNGKREKDSYIAQCGDGDGCNFPTKFKVPAGYYFMMGDNRGSSDDSRFWGPVPKKWIIGVAFFTYWPPDRIGFL
ncbi:MAG TPA: signal peptidase I [Solirubrobacteraceae bacterium]|jgi:signal peptidase I|nr:signal peptidase I [Solirubrobacteraceae bacterium]